MPSYFHFNNRCLWERADWCTTSIAPRCSHTATVISNKIYIIGGGAILDVDFQHFNDVWEIVPELKSSKEIKCNGAVFLARRGHTAVAYKDRYIYVFGGIITVSGMNRLSNELLVLDTHTCSWKIPIQTEPKPVPRRGHGSAIYGDNLFIIGGDTPPVEHSHLSIYNILTEVWTSVDHSTIPQQLSLSNFLTCDRFLYCFGGTIDGTLSNHLFSLNLVSLQWKEEIYDYIQHTESQALQSHECLRNKVSPRFCASGALIWNDSNEPTMIIYGGTSIRNKYLSEIISFKLGNNMNYSNRNNNTLNQIQCNQIHNYYSNSTNDLDYPVPTERNGASLSCINSQYLVLFGGGIFPTSYSNECWILHLLPPCPLLGIDLYNSRCELLSRTSSNKINDLTANNRHNKDTISCNQSANNVFGYFEEIWLSGLHSDINLRVMTDCNISNNMNYSQSVGSNPNESLTSNFDYCEIKAHKIVLSSRCIYFRTLLDGKWNNVFDPVDSNTLVLPMSYRPMFQALYWIYTNKFPSDVFDMNSFDSEHVIKFLEVCNMLCLDECKYRCEEYLTSALSLPSSSSFEIVLNEIISSCRLLSISETFSCENLMKAIITHLKSIQIISTCRSSNIYLINNSNMSMDNTCMKTCYIELLQCQDISTWDWNKYPQITPYQELVHECICEMQTLSSELQLRVVELWEI